MGDRVAQFEQAVDRLASKLADQLTHYLYEEGRFDPVYRSVTTKTDFVRRYNLGEFGNRSPTWDNVDEWYKAPNIGMGDLFHLRNRVAGGLTKYNVAAWDLLDDYEQMLYEGVNSTDIYVSAMCPTERTQIQGEVMRTPSGLYLYYSTIKKPMRDALREGGKEATGLRAKMMLEHYFDTASYEWMQVLLDRYPDHVLEFTCLDVEWGTVPNRRVLWWEIRRY